MALIQARWIMALCEIISTIETFGDILFYPVTCNYYFYLEILGAIFVILAFGIYWKEKGEYKNPDMISILAVCSIAVAVLATILTLIENSSGDPVLSRDILLIIAAFTTIFVAIWAPKR